MPRLLGVDIPANKKIEFSLQYIYGIGPQRARQLCDEAGIDPNVRAHELSEEDLNKVVNLITQKGFKVEGDLRREVTGNMKRLQAIRCYRGIRHQRGLPCRGQRTQTNARTRKGGRRTVGVVKKK
ncbi:30S ribosomal protein S13 [Ruficoccus sp. ZRK36]|uniref:30S ribosomal protein S13 n=1 Tax=Ruficoccus sp. ZRK36 TaxID=2866311 RepID=UPI001C737409|nr:30S ribosomal protein S13 [Ruficoccus sp. ZRK36]QYY35844.1 30S ribosomal protein S13 [Ruficoccus sp. ZRK36]